MAAQRGRKRGSARLAERIIQRVHGLECGARAQHGRERRQVFVTQAAAIEFKDAKWLCRLDQLCRW